MVASDVSERSLARLSEAHLHQLVEIARDDLDGFFSRNPHLSVYRSRVLLTALCQGAALHYLDHSSGVKDLDVWTFFAALPDLRLQRRRPKQVDFGPSELGRHPADHGYVGRRVDLLLKTIDRKRGQSGDDAVRAYLAAGKTATACHLGQKAVLGLHPPEYFGFTIWTPR
jgi:hypothetical protein